MITRRSFAIAGSLALASSIADARTSPSWSGNMSNPNVWAFGPVVDGTNYSAGMPPRPAPNPEGWSFDFPPAPGSVHYLTAPYGPMTGKSALILRYRIEAGPGVVLYPTRFFGSPSILSLYFQRAGDDWTAEGPFEAYRWYSPEMHSPMEAGDHELIAPLNGNWTAVMTSSAETNPSGFAEAKENCAVVGMTFGGGDGRGHGVSATGPARFVCKSFEIV